MAFLKTPLLLIAGAGPSGGNRRIQEFSSRKFERQLSSEQPEAYRVNPHYIIDTKSEATAHPSHIREGAWLSGVYYVNMPKVISEGNEGQARNLELGRPDCKMPSVFKTKNIGGCS